MITTYTSSWINCRNVVARARYETRGRGRYAMRSKPQRHKRRRLWAFRRAAKNAEEGWRAAACFLCYL